MPAKYGQHNVSEHNTSPKKSNEKKYKQGEGEEMPDLNENDKVAYCDTCTEQEDQLIKCERCDKLLCSNCEIVSDEIISLTGKLCDFSVHW